MAKTTVLSALIGGGVVAAAFVFNPTADQHRDRIKAAIAERSPIAGALGIGALTAFTSTYHPIGNGSYTTVNDRIASVGAFGLVFVTQTPLDKQ